MTNFAISKPHFSPEDFSKIDSRFLGYLRGWKVTETYKDKLVTIPLYIIFNYFEYTDTPNEMEKQVSIWCGWNHDTNGITDGLMDAEVIINLRLENDAVANNTDDVHAEILKSGGAQMQVFWNGTLVTDFHSDGHVIVDNIQYRVKYPNGYQARSMKQYMQDGIS